MIIRVELDDRKQLGSFIKENRGYVLGLQCLQGLPFIEAAWLGYQEYLVESWYVRGRMTGNEAGKLLRRLGFGESTADLDWVIFGGADMGRRQSVNLGKYS